MEHIVSIVQYLESFNDTSVNLRQVRAGVLAQLISNQIVVDKDDDIDDIVGDNKDTIKKIVSQINEYTSIDLNLTLAIIRQLLVVRHTLIYGVTDVDLLRFVMTNKIAQDTVDPKVIASFGEIAANNESTARLCSLSNELFKHYSGTIDND